MFGLGGKRGGEVEHVEREHGKGGAREVLTLPPCLPGLH